VETIIEKRGVSIAPSAIEGVLSVAVREGSTGGA
jgi:hypothetical protein